MQNIILSMGYIHISTYPRWTWTEEKRDPSPLQLETAPDLQLFRLADVGPADPPGVVALRLRDFLFLTDGRFTESVL